MATWSMVVKQQPIRRELEAENGMGARCELRTWGLRESNNRKACGAVMVVHYVAHQSQDSELLIQHERQNSRRTRSLISKQRTQWDWHRVNRIWIAPFSASRGGNNGRRGQLLSCTSGWTPATSIDRFLWPSPSSSSFLL